MPWPKRKTRQDPDSFREFVIHVLAERFDGLPVERSAEPLVIALPSGEYGLQSLHAIQRRDNPTRDEMASLVIEHFERMFAESGQRGDESAPMHWAEAQPRLRPQFMPTDYVRQAPAPLAYAPVNEDVCIALVVDLDRTYSYVRAEDLSLWGVSFDTAGDHAAANLELASAEMAVHISDGPSRFAAIEMKDGYDAARILLPGFRSFLAERLGELFFVGIPNRDFLICWSRTAPAEFQAFVRDKIAADFRQQPYPLTPMPLVVTNSSISPEHAG